ncbi:MAG: Ribosomal protein L21E [Candidatus Methanohalarchaeum thermophilum]|uniref:Large ribosomal subunit protein eL21 n=1 Tax=Methanohalarchaeum thermophilum TaxID=1903181 RepID=A0A1Q6DXY8_METT1|nr:MAG: Ribosomal protein L21E [Candidatus Methanohalarchaeum thermophilum]
MSPNSQGSRRGTRKKLKKDERKKGLSSITESIRDFDVGQRVHIKIDSSVQKGMPHPRFHGKTGEVVEKRGRGYVVEVSDKSTKKKVTIRPEHLIPQESE